MFFPPYIPTVYNYAFTYRGKIHNFYFTHKKRIQKQKHLVARKIAPLALILNLSKCQRIKGTVQPKLRKVSLGGATIVKKSKLDMRRHFDTGTRR